MNNFIMLAVIKDSTKKFQSDFCITDEEEKEITIKMQKEFVDSRFDRAVLPAPGSTYILTEKFSVSIKYPWEATPNWRYRYGEYLITIYDGGLMITDIHRSKWFAMTNKGGDVERFGQKVYLESDSFDSWLFRPISIEPRKYREFHDLMLEDLWRTLHPQLYKIRKTILSNRCSMVEEDEANGLTKSEAEKLKPENYTHYEEDSYWEYIYEIIPENH